MSFKTATIDQIRITDHAGDTYALTRKYVERLLVGLQRAGTLNHNETWRDSFVKVWKPDYTRLLEGDILAFELGGHKGAMWFDRDDLPELIEALQAYLGSPAQN